MTITKPTRAKLVATPLAAPGERIIISAVEGFGKTSLGAFSPNCAILMTKGESGYLTLLNRGLVPQRDSVMLETWVDTLAVLNDLRTNCPYQTIVLDALSGLERLCWEHVAARDYSSDLTPKSGFFAYGKGPESALFEWQKLLSALDAISLSGKTVLVLAHTKIKPFTPPGSSEGYSRYVVDTHEKTWGLTAKWSDAVFFGNFATRVIKNNGGKNTAQTSVARTLYVERTAEWDAKNRFGLRDPISLPDGPQAAYEAFHAAIELKPSIESLSQQVPVAVDVDEIPS